MNERYSQVTNAPLIGTNNTARPLTTAFDSRAHALMNASIEKLVSM